MTGDADTHPFVRRIPILERFGEIVDPDRYVALPDDWVVGLSDVVSSTAAIAAGRYKSVNMAGASVISALSNAVGHGAFPFVFGGDGASFAVPPEWADRSGSVLAATATFAREELDLTLRIGMVPVAAVRAAGQDLRVARFAPSPDVTYAMFSGGGLAWAEDRLKAGAFALPEAPPGTRPDLTGLSCRFDAIAARNGTILSLIVRPGKAGEGSAYRDLIQRILARVDAAGSDSRPVPEGGPPFRWPAPGLELELKALGRLGGPTLLDRLRLLAFTAFARLIFLFRVPIGGFQPTRYLTEVVANSDYRKYDDGLRMTIDCSPELADALDAMLAEAAARGLVAYGTHRQDAALMTCFTPSPTQSDHVHFIDGAAGGYAAAAAQLKRAGA